MSEIRETHCTSPSSKQRSSRLPPSRYRDGGALVGEGESASRTPPPGHQSRIGGTWILGSLRPPHSPQHTIASAVLGFWVLGLAGSFESWRMVTPGCLASAPSCSSARRHTATSNDDRKPHTSKISSAGPEQGLSSQTFVRGVYQVRSAKTAKTVLLQRRWGLS